MEGEAKSLDVDNSAQFDEDGNMYLKKGGHQKIFTHFKNLYINRVQHVGSQKKYSHGYVDNSARDTHKPKISEKTAKLAAQKRAKVHGKQNISIVELLLTPAQNQEPLEKIKNEKSEKEVEECTFKPKTLHYNSGAQPSHGDKCLDLYSRVPKGVYKDKRMLTKEEYEFERAKEELTFVPKINEGVPQEEGVPTHQIRGVDKQMERLQKAREQQFQKKMMTERGMPTQLSQKLTQGEPKMNFGTNTAKFKSGFGVDGSQLNPKKGLTASTVAAKSATYKSQREA